MVEPRPNRNAHGSCKTGNHRLSSRLADAHLARLCDLMFVSGANFWPASSSRTRRRPSALSRAPRTAPAEPPPTIMTSKICKWIQASKSRLLLDTTSKCRHFLRRSRSYQSEFFLILTILAQIKFGESLAYVLQKAARLDHRHCQASTGMESQAMKLHI
jgi:hypothetical protein